MFFALPSAACSSVKIIMYNPDSYPESVIRMPLARTVPRYGEEGVG